MASPNTKAALKEHCLRSLGKPVIDINVDDDQVDDRVDEALQYYQQYHYDGIRRTYLKYQYTQACLLYTSPSPRDYAASRMPSSA